MGQLESGPRLVAQIASGVQVSASLKKLPPGSVLGQLGSIIGTASCTALYGAEPQPSSEGTKRDGSHRASGFLSDKRHGSAPTAALVTDQTTDHVQAGDPYFRGEVLSDPTVSSRTASRPSGCQNTSI